MGIGLIAIFGALAAAGWLLLRVARNAGTASRNESIFKGVIFLALVAALLAAKLWPLAFMTLVAAGAVTGIELWRAREVAQEERAEAQMPPQASSDPVMKLQEAASILGVEEDADAAMVKAAHKKLISQLHPDKGGTDYLAAKINDARNFMLARLEGTPQAPSEPAPDQAASDDENVS